MSYFDELAALLRQSSNAPDHAELVALRSRHDIEQITSFRGGTPPPVLLRA